MRVLLFALLLIQVLPSLGATQAAADALGPICLQRTPAGEILELFAVPSGGSNVLLSGRIGPAATGAPLSGSGYVTGDDFKFSVSGQAPNITGRLQVTDGTLSLATGTGTGRCYAIGLSTGCGGGTAVTYTLVACPATDAEPALGSRGE